MPVFRLPKEPVFPPVEFAEPDGLLAVSTDLGISRLQEAYKNGIFPWPVSEQEILWFSPNPRFVIFPNEIHISKNFRSFLKKNRYEITLNAAFNQVIKKCSEFRKKGRESTWITPKIIKEYIVLHQMGKAYSIEAWSEQKLIGGLYGVVQGSVFCGESMFSLSTNASKVSLFYLPQLLPNIKLIDCQIYSEHLAQMGGRFIPRKEFLNFLK